MTEDDLAAAYPWPAARPWVRSMMVITLDGASTGADGLTRSISSAADQQVFAETRRLADAVLVGAGTVRAERYTPVLASPASVAERSALGLASAPRLVIVSASLRLPWTDRVFTESAIRPLVVTVENCDGAALVTAHRHADVAVMAGTRVDPVSLLEHLARLDLLRVVCEGGPHLLADLVRADVVDEADVSVAPMFTGGGQKDTGTVMFEPGRLALVHVIADDGYLFNRYVRTATTS